MWKKTLHLDIKNKSTALNNEKNKIKVDLFVIFILKKVTYMHIHVLTHANVTINKTLQLSITARKNENLKKRVWRLKGHLVVNIENCILFF